MLDDRIKFDERYDDEENKSTTLYFTAPKELLKEFDLKNYPEAISIEISLEFPLDCIVPEHAYVSVSPTNKNGEDYDWCNFDYMDCNDIEALIELAKASIE